MRGFIKDRYVITGNDYKVSRNVFVMQHNAHLSYFSDTAVINIPRQVPHARNVKQKATLARRHRLSASCWPLHCLYLVIESARTTDKPNEELEESVREARGGITFATVTAA